MQLYAYGVIEKYNIKNEIRCFYLDENIKVILMKDLKFITCTLRLIYMLYESRCLKV